MEPTTTDFLRFVATDFGRDDEGDDASFYARDRFVNHLDDVALATVERVLGALVPETGAAVLDLMASWDSHLPDTVRPARMVGLGLNRHELADNERLTEHLLHDLNAEPRLPFDDDTFDAVLCTVSVDYLTRPVEVFTDVARILKPGGVFVVTFSNRFFPPKVVRIWREAGDDERVDLVRAFFANSGAFAKPRVFISKGRPRPADDRYAASGIPSDPVYVVFADSLGGESGTTRPLDGVDEPARLPDPDTVRERKLAVSETLCCPYCAEPLSRWEVPNTPFIEWTSTYQFICFNDDCPYYVRGWNTFARQNTPGSYRFMYDPDTDACHAVPVLTPEALRASIVPQEHVDTNARDE